LALPLALLALLSGCAQYRPEAISVSAQAQALDERTLENPRLQAFLSAALEPQERAQTSSWTLARLTLAALYYHPDLEVARSKLEIARASVTTAGQIPNPTGSATLMLSPITVSPSIDFLIETFGRRGYRTAQAQALADSAREDIMTAAWQVRGRVRTAMLDAWAAERRSGFLQDRFTLQDQLVQLLERRLEEGEASTLEVTRERINRNQLSLALRDAERQDADARARLAAAVGVPARSLDGETLSFEAFDLEPSPFPADLSELRREALTHRADVTSLVAQYRAAESALQLEIAKQYPNVTLGPGYTYEPGTGGYEFTVATSAEIPLFNHNQGPIAEAAARRRGIAAQVTWLQAQTLGAVDAAVANYRSATAAVETADSLFTESSRRNDQILRSFQAGQTDRPTLVSAGIESATAALSRFEARVQQRQAVGALEDALQRELFDPETNLAVPEMNPESAP
jgi:outer membrane protein TolC